MAWIGGNRFLSMDEMKNNAKEVWSCMFAYGWSLNATCAMLGNMQSESNINPQIWESLTVNPKRGYGLVQWTPSTKYTSWAGENYANGSNQCARIEYEKNNEMQWFRNPNAPIQNPPITFKQFSTSKRTLSDLANYFLWYYEHPAQTVQPNRAQQAIYWHKYLSGQDPELPDWDDDPPIDPPPAQEDPQDPWLKTGHVYMPVYMMLRKM